MIVMLFAFEAPVMVGDNRVAVARGGGRGLGDLEMELVEFLDGVDWVDWLAWEGEAEPVVVEEEAEDLVLNLLKRPRVVCVDNCRLSAFAKAYRAMLSLSSFKLLNNESKTK